jgi:cytosine/adenosine deaminase-related metal-dependent hydrolase
MVESAELARKRNVRLHTHLAETKDEEEFCLEEFGFRPVEYLEDLGWLGEDVWLAHCVHLDENEVRQFGETRTGVAHCPSSNARLGAGVAPVAALVGAGAPVGLGVDGAASNEGGELSVELRQALLMARAIGGPRAMGARRALELATIHGARCLGREAEIGSLEPGKLADIALWKIDGIGHAGIEDPVAALVFGPPRQAEKLFVNGEAVIEGGELRTADEREIAREMEKASKRLASKAQKLKAGG